MGVHSRVQGKVNRAVFLDRDGVINRPVLRQGKPHPPESLSELEIPSEVYPALMELASAGFWLIVVTNQPDVARGTQSREAVEAMNAHLKAHLPLDQILTCYHDDQDQCSCRKPKPGLILEAAGSMKIDLTQSYMVGDRWRDIEAGQRAGCKTVFIDYSYNERQPDAPDFSVRSLAEAADVILEASKKDKDF